MLLCLLFIDGVGTKVKPFSSNVLSEFFNLKVFERFIIVFEFSGSFFFSVLCCVSIFIFLSEVECVVLLNEGKNILDKGVEVL